MKSLGVWIWVSTLISERGSSPATPWVKRLGSSSYTRQWPSNRQLLLEVWIDGR